MAETVELPLAGGWELLYTNSGAVNIPIVLTTHGQGMFWAVKENTTLPVESFKGHIVPRNEDMQRIVEPGETLFVNGSSGHNLYHSIGD